MDIDLMRDVLGVDCAGFQIACKSFEYMTVVEEEISLARALSGDRRRYEGEFLVCKPTDPLRNKDMSVYRAHCRELQQRIRTKNARAMSLATDAEIACICSETSKRAPLTSLGLAVYEYAMIRVYEAAEQPQPTRMGREDYPGEVLEETSRLRNKYAQNWRLKP